jgi:threonine 3-dehydrogenase
MSNLMRALVKARPEPGLWMQEVPVPEPGSNDVLIRVEKSAICGTDVHIWNWDEWAAKTVPVPMVVGHEFFGTVADTGAAVTRFRPGQRVSGEGHIVCGFCRNCRAGRGHLCRNTLGVGVHRPGSFAEYLVIPEANVVAIPDDVPDEIAAIFDPFGNAVHTALSFDNVGEDVLVTGAGPIGIMGALVAKRAGARKVVITDINPARLALARRMGVDYVVDASRENLRDVMAAIGMREGFDIGLEMSGAAPAFRDMIDVMNNGGRIAILGIAPAAFEIDWNNVIFKMLTLKGIYGREMFESWYKMIALVQSGLDVSPLITHRIPIDAFAEGFAAMRSGDAGKVVMDWRA